MILIWSIYFNDCACHVHNCHLSYPRILVKSNSNELQTSPKSSLELLSNKVLMPGIVDMLEYLAWVKVEARQCCGQRLDCDWSGTMLWPVVLDTQVLWSLHMVHYYIYYYLVLILLYTTNNQSHSINTVVCGLQISSHSLAGYEPCSVLKDSASLLLLSL